MLGKVLAWPSTREWREDVVVVVIVVVVGHGERFSLVILLKVSLRLLKTFLAMISALVFFVRQLSFVQLGLVKMIAKAKNSTLEFGRFHL